MTFSNITTGHECNCLEKTVLTNSAEIFLRKLRKDLLEDKDFHSHWERGIGQNSSLCAEICDYKGISVNKANAGEEAAIVNHYKITFTINPKKGAHCIKFRFKEDAGRLKHAPLEGAESHHNFYKADLFDIGHIEQIEIIKFG